MTIEYSPRDAGSRSIAIFKSPERRTVASYERELTRHRRTEIGLRAALVREDALLREKDELIRQQTVLGEESDHRLLNGLQMIGSLLSLRLGRRRMARSLQVWPPQPIASPRSDAFTGAFTHWTACKPSHSSNTSTISVATSP